MVSGVWVQLALAGLQFVLAAAASIPQLSGTFSTGSAQAAAPVVYLWFLCGNSWFQLASSNFLNAAASFASPRFTVCAALS